MFLQTIKLKLYNQLYLMHETTRTCHANAASNNPIFTCMNFLHKTWPYSCFTVLFLSKNYIYIYILQIVDGEESNIENIGQENSHIRQGISWVKYGFSNILSIGQLTAQQLSYFHSNSYTKSQQQ